MLNPTDWRITMAGDAAVTIEYPPRIDPLISQRVVALAARIRAARHVGVRDVVPSYHAVTVYFEPTHTDLASLWTALEEEAELPGAMETPSREVIVPVVYGGVDGPDLGEVASFSGCTTEEVVRLHTSVLYRVYMVGFLPDYPYLGDLAPEIALSRKVTPSLRIPARSIAIAERMTAVYPLESPGGWHVIGRTPMKLFDETATRPALLAPGDRVRFTPIARSEYDHLLQIDDGINSAQPQSNPAT